MYPQAAQYPSISKDIQVRFLPIKSRSVPHSRPSPADVSSPQNKLWPLADKLGAHAPHEDVENFR